MPHLDPHKVTGVVVVGAGHGIGLGLAKGSLERFPRAKVAATYRNADKASPLKDFEQAASRLQTYQLDPLSPKQLEGFAKELARQSEGIQVCVNAVGMLHEGERGPEKSLRDIDSDWLTKVFQVNAVVTPLLAKAFFPLLRGQHPTLFAAVSAKVGSISDNGMGGWYGYRASKAALNMFLKNISLELPRRGCHTLVAAIHPGTTVTELSQPFIQNTKYQLHSPEETGTHIWQVLLGLDFEQQGKFWSWDGQELPW